MQRRGFIGVLTGFLVAPAIVRASSLMPVSIIDPLVINPPDFWLSPHNSEHWQVPKWTAGWYQKGQLPSYEEVEERRVPYSVRRKPQTFQLQADYDDVRKAQNVPFMKMPRNTDWDIEEQIEDLGMPLSEWRAKHLVTPGWVRALHPAVEVAKR